MAVVSLEFVHLVYQYQSGRYTACGVCLRHSCTESQDDVTCPACLRLMRETDLLSMIE